MVGTQIALLPLLVGLGSYLSHDLRLFDNVEPGKVSNAIKALFPAAGQNTAAGGGGRGGSMQEKRGLGGTQICLPPFTDCLESFALSSTTSSVMSSLTASASASTSTSLDSVTTTTSSVGIHPPGHTSVAGGLNLCTPGAPPGCQNMDGVNVNVHVDPAPPSGAGAGGGGAQEKKIILMQSPGGVDPCVYPYTDCQQTFIAKTTTTGTGTASDSSPTVLVLGHGGHGHGLEHFAQIAQGTAGGGPICLWPFDDCPQTFAVSVPTGTSTSTSLSSIPPSSSSSSTMTRSATTTTPCGSGDTNCQTLIGTDGRVWAGGIPICLPPYTACPQTFVALPTPHPHTHPQVTTSGEAKSRGSSMAALSSSVAQCQASLTRLQLQLELLASKSKAPSPSASASATP